MAEHDRRGIFERRRNIIYLITEYLKECGLTKSHSALIEESQLSPEFTVCDNVDLETIYLEFSSFYSLKFGKKPRFVKRNENPQKLTSVSSVDSRQSLAKRRSILKTAPNVVTMFPEIGPAVELETSLRVTSLSPPTPPPTPAQQADSNIAGIFMKPMRDFLSNHPTEWKDMSEMIMRDVVKKNLSLQWDDIVGLDDAKMVIKESVIFPLKYPQLYGKMQSWKAVLLHGVPGCGKTLLAKALCTETHEVFTFFNISASTLISKWRGESEKLIRVLFELAKYHEPAIIFIDELDSLTSKRHATEHEASKRLKNEFLSLLDGLESDENGKVFVLGSTNLPWDIDSAFLRRFERKILIDVPTLKERQNLIKVLHPHARSWRADDMEELALSAENFTGDDIRVAVKEANMMIIRKKIRNGNFATSESAEDVEIHHLKEALKHVKVNPENDVNKHRQWNSSFVKN